jgi:hypothetical protein
MGFATFDPENHFEIFYYFLFLCCVTLGGKRCIYLLYYVHMYLLIFRPILFLLYRVLLYELLPRIS